MKTRRRIWRTKVIPSVMLMNFSNGTKNIHVIPAGATLTNLVITLTEMQFVLNVAFLTALINTAIIGQKIKKGINKMDKPINETIFFKKTKIIMDYFFDKLGKVQIEVEKEDKGPNYNGNKTSSIKIKFR